MLRPPLEVGGGHLTVGAEMGEIDHGRFPDPLVDRHVRDGAVAGQEVPGRIHMGVGVTGQRHHRRLEVVAPCVG